MSIYRDLTGPNRDAGVALISMFEEYGLGSLAPRIIEYLQQGFQADTVYLLLQETPEWRERFKANEERRRRGLGVLTPQEYLAAERGYRAALRAAGMPAGLWDSPEDFHAFLGRDISPDEVSERAMRARELADSVDPEQKRALRRMGIDSGDLAAFYLNPTRALPVLDRQVDLAMLDAERTRFGFGSSRNRAEALYGLGVSAEQAREGYSTIAQSLPTLSRLAQTRGSLEGGYGLRDLENEVFGGDADATRRRRRMESQERARFSGSGGLGDNTFGRDRRFN